MNAKKQVIILIISQFFVINCAGENGSGDLYSDSDAFQFELSCSMCKSSTPDNSQFPEPAINLVPNPSAEKKSPEEQMPEDWITDVWGDMKAAFTWEQKNVHSGARSLKVQVNDYKEGDAKWVFTPQSLESDRFYEFGNMHSGNVRGRYMWFCEDKDTHKRSYHNAWQSNASDYFQYDRFRFYIPPEWDCLVSVMHILDRDGYLVTDSYYMVQADPYPLPKPAVTIAFDDIWESAITIGAAELESRGMKGTFFVSRRLVEYPLGKYAGTSMVKSLIASKKGHEIGSHTANHKFLSKLDMEDVQTEIEQNLKFLEGLGVEVTGLAYPYGDFDAKVEKEVAKYHCYARTSMEGLNDGTTNPCRLRIYPVTSESVTEEILSRIDDADHTSTWVILLFHGLGDPAPGDPYLSSASQFIEILDYIQSKNIKVLTVSEELKEAGLVQ
jgi:peptidoglycan/xylan/chitin deacetylase (PgdA/CDA1 family)